MTTSTTATLRIFAFKEFAEDPNESLRRHVALHFTYDDGSPHTIYHITGSAYNWKFERRPNYDPTTSDKDVRTYTVGRLEQPTSDAEIEKMLEEVKIDNDNVEKNCQHWVGDALMQLGKCDMLNEDRLDDALDGLADLVVDWDGAEDERSDSVVKDRFSEGWRWLDLDRKTLALMFNTPVSEVYTSLGFLVSIIAVVTVNILPRAKLIQLTFTIRLWTAFAIPLAMLAAWSALQARLHTDPQGLSKYNSSQSAVTAVWLFFHIWLSNSIQARYPSLLIATILYNIFMIVQFTSVATYTTWAQCWNTIYLTIRCYYTGVAISFFSGILVYPLTCRTEIFEMQERFVGEARGSLEAMVDYVGEQSSLSTRDQDGSGSDGDGEGDKTKMAHTNLWLPNLLMR
ncbi:hypothetical protein PRZ48_010374 [Zasmidium cellare]|uniref:Putative ER transporter 6TM N-terminal domain-containing protein n=1 Tax=Zasmidium cellare TaxID=395010 RepID=A0ABR0E911_ZASCE|nr:hypothetical protein PRZ48_010374 [Zasmidium cellare]